MIECAQRTLLWLIFLGMATPSLLAANNHEFRIQLEWMPDSPEAAAVSAIVEELLPDGRRLESEGPQPWIFNLQTTTNLVTDFQIDVQGLLPSGYTIGDLRMSVPFYYAQTVDIWLFPTRRSADAKSVRHLYATDIKEFSTKRLFSFYQEARAIALQRIAELEGEPMHLHAYDVQAAFKFLEASLELNHRTRALLGHSGEIMDTRDWLLEMYGVKEELVSKAIGAISYRQIVDQIAEEEAYLMTQLWDEIRSIGSFENRLPPMKAFYERFKRTTDAGDLESKMRLHLGTVLSSLNECVIEAVAKNEELPASARASYLTNQVDETRSQLRLTENPAVANKLRSDLEVMRNWIDTLESR